LCIFTIATFVLHSIQIFFFDTYSNICYFFYKLKYLYMLKINFHTKIDILPVTYT
jgi:hypothetical protein